jgi:hypothetical protein
VAVVELWFDPETGAAEGIAPADASPDPAGRWRIIVEDDAVSILGDTGKSKVGLIGAGRWSGSGIARRYAVDAPISDSTWGKLEHALRRARSGDAPGAAEEVAGYAEAIVELTSGRILHQQRSPSERRAANAFEWKVVIDGERVTVHSSSEGSFAHARWDGERLSGREVRPARLAVNDYQWGVVEKAVIEVVTGRAAPMPARASAGAAPERERAGLRPRDRRSGWWALGAIGVALAGALVSWWVMPSGDPVALGITIALGAGAIALAIYGGYGLGTRCPSCRSWYRRETTATTTTGTSTYSKQIDEPVRDSSGKQIGTTSVTATYERTEYRYDYRCKECSHRWTGHGSSERRVR